MKRSEKSAKSRADAPVFAQQVIDYWVDAWQRTILFWDVLRERGNRYHAQQEKAEPHVLHFEADRVLDGRSLDPPANYFLSRIKPPKGTRIVPRKRPFVVVDPRAGHGPGIGGFKADSEIGVAMEAGHPCYFIGFTPQPMPGQRITDILGAEAMFLEKVIDLHPKADGKPCVIGNCQAGWAVLMLAATRPELFGPIIAAGAPLSYWAGVEGKNPMRYTGGLLGGSWLTALASDLGGGRFDGAYLVGNFENLNPANTIWTKSYNVWAKVDTEAKRFLDFETYWGGMVNLNAEEIQWIVNHLFVGNRLATAEITTGNGVRVDLRNIRSPIICFCSQGDNITPPQQALGWIVDLYRDDDDILACDQTIVYAIHENIGHLGIFVSGSVARKEHEEFSSNIDLIDVLPPGLYEMVMTPKTARAAHPELIVGDWITRIEPRTLDDVRAIVKPSLENERRFATVRRVSEINLGLYRMFMQPFVRAFANEPAADWLHKVNPTVLPFELFSDRNPFMKPVAEIASQVRTKRRPASPDNPLLLAQAMVSQGIVNALDAWRESRDRGLELMFMGIYNQPLLQAMVGLRDTDERPRRQPGVEPERIAYVRAKLAERRARIAEGGLHEATIRGLIYIAMDETGIDERHFEALRLTRAHRGEMSLDAFKKVVRDQFSSLRLDHEAALAAIPGMLPAAADVRAKTIEAIRRIVFAAGKPTAERARRLDRVEALFAAAGRQRRRPGRAGKKRGFTTPSSRQQGA